MFTASQREYAEKIVKALDPEREVISCILSRENCINRDGIQLKDLRIIDGKELKDMIIVDNTIACFSDQIDNGIYVPSFYGNANDTELLKIMIFLIQIHEEKDVRPSVVEFAGICKLYEKFKDKLCKKSEEKK